jgi:hypothetical protein
VQHPRLPPPKCASAWTGLSLMAEASMATSSMQRYFFSLLALQLILGLMVVIGLFHLGFWRTAGLETCKFAVVLPQAFRFRRASLDQCTVAGHSSLLAMAGAALLAISAFSDAILISYDVQRGQ